MPKDTTLMGMIKNIFYNEKMLQNLRLRYLNAKTQEDKDKIASIGKSKKKLLEDLRSDYLKEVKNFYKDDEFVQIVADVLIK